MKITDEKTACKICGGDPGRYDFDPLGCACVRPTDGLRRYAMVFDGEEGWIMLPDPDGEYVRFDDAAALAEQTQQGVELKKLEWTGDGDCYAFADVTHQAYSIAFEEGKYWANWDMALPPFDTLEAARAAAQSDYETRIRRALVDVPAVESEPNLDARMKAAGMYTIAEMMGVTPLTKWKSNPAINTIDSFAEWLDRKVSEYLTMKARYDLGDKSTDDELYEWVEAHAAVFGTIRDQFQVVRAALSTRKGSAGDGSATGTNGGDHG